VTSLVGVGPARLLETRRGAGYATIDHFDEGGGPVPAGTIFALIVTGRGGVPVDATSVVLNVTATKPMTDGFVTVFPCGGQRPLASNVNFAAGATVANAVITKVGGGRSVCLFNSTPMDLVVDVTAFAPPAAVRLSGIVPARLLETRSGPDLTTADRQYEGLGAVTAGGTVQLPIAGRGGTPVDADAAILNLTVTNPATAGFVTVYPCGGDQPTASNVNFVAGATVADAVLAKLGSNGSVCVFTSASTDLVVDVTGYLS
jgi:hypothetical protein